MDKEWLNDIPGAICMTDAGGNILFFNDAAVTLWGRRPEPGVDRWTGAWKMYQWDGSPMAADRGPLATAVKAGRQLPPQEVILERPDGSRRVILAHPKPLFDKEGRVTGALNILIDVTDVRRTEELKETRELYHKMISEVEDYAILMLDSGGVIRNWNVGAEKIKGYKEQEIVGKHFRIFYTAGDRQAGLPERLIEQARDKGKAIHEGWRQRKDGTLFWGSIVITALHDHMGKVIGFSKVTRDLTARRVAEEQMRRYSMELEFQNQELQQFAYAAAHDLKEPLRKLRFYNTSALDSLQGRLSEKEEKFLTRAKEAAERMQTLIDDLLTYSKASMEGEASGWVDLNDIVRDAQTIYQDTVEEVGAVIEIKDLPMVWGIGFQLRQLFENLLGNSLKYRDQERPLLIRISGEKNYYLPDGTPAKDTDAREYFRITVEDNGIGFDQDRSGRIFDIFQRLDSRKEIGGTGIGLAICKRVAQNHKGLIIANGSPGKGAKFMIFLPVVGASTGFPQMD